MKKRDYNVKSNNKKKTQIGRIIGVTALAVLAGIYIVGFFFFRVRFLPQTQINGIACGGKKVSVLQQKIVEEANTYRLQIAGRDGLTDSISADEIKMAPVFDDTIERLLQSQKTIFWPVQIWKKYCFETSTVIKYDEDAFKNRIGTLVFCKKSNQRKPVDAYLSDVTSQGFEIIPEDRGSTILPDILTETIGNAVLTLTESIDLDKEGCYQEPRVKSDDAQLLQQRDALNHFVQTKVEYQFGDEIVATTPEIIYGWLMQDEKGNLSLSEEKVREFVNDMARKYDTFGKRRTFETYGGETIEITEGTYGWWMNRAEETKELAARITAGESGVKTPVYYATAAQYGPQDWGNTYVEIDLTQQHLYVYVEGQVALETDFVSGNVSKGNGTPPGIFGITYKERNANLVGQGYNSAVSFWMPFNNNVGMHDASWRKSFGGDIYLTNGSHGCINLPKEIAGDVYDLIEKNTPVIVYGGKTLPKKEEEAQTPEQEPTQPFGEEAVPNMENVLTPETGNPEQNPENTEVAPIENTPEEIPLPSGE